MLKVISLFAGPGAGKSTTAAALFNLMKRQRFSVELVTEVAKDWTYEKNVRLGDQFSVLTEQNWRLQRLEGQVEWVVTDSPLPLGLAYCPPKDADALEVMIDTFWHRYDNYPFILKRTSKEYQTFGRSQTLSEAQALDGLIANIAADFDADCFPVMDPDDPAVEYKILEACLNDQT